MGMINREHILQKHVKTFARDAIEARHEFMAFDRAKAAGKFSHMVQKARGVRKGTPDTLLLVDGIPPIWCELKAPGNKPDADQTALGDALMAVGCYWSWITSVDAYRLWLAACGVPLRANAEYIAAIHDGQVASVIARAEAAAPKKPGAPRKAGPRYLAGKGFTKRNAALIGG